MEGGVSIHKFVLALVVVALASVFGTMIVVKTMQRPATFSLDGSSLESSAAACNVLGIQIYGNIVSNSASVDISQQVPRDASSTSASPNYTASNRIEDVLRYYSQDLNTKALLVDVDSPGGGVVAGEEIAHAVHRFGKPSVAVIHEIGASAGYLAASAADMVFASQNSAVGSIGATQSYLDYSEKDKKEGIQFVSLSSGPFKDWSADKPLTKVERDLFMRDIMILKDNFVNMVAEFRHQPADKINALADGSTMLGLQAKQNGLIDEVGGTEEAIAYLEQKIGEPVSICWQ